MNKFGKFISFEGPEAAGKSEQIKHISKYLKNKNIPFLVTREPGGTLIAENLRKIILNKRYNISNTEELLLLMSSRLNHINNIILPALNNGKLVISDRFCDSTFVYQCYFNKFGVKKGIELHNLLLNKFYPYKTFLFLLKPSTIVKRLKKRKKTNKYDKLDIKFHKKIIQGYKKLSSNNKRFVLVNADNSFEDIQNHLRKYILKIIKK